MNQKILEVSGLKKHFPIYAGLLRRQVGAVRAVDDVSFAVREGEVLGVVGESGCGKSTLARTVIRLLEPTDGSISLFGEDFLTHSSSKLAALRREVQIVFQDPYASLNPRKTVGESIDEPLRYHKIVLDPELRRAKVAEVLELVGLSSEAMDRYPHQFSGGQQQRICIARALALEPKLIVFDEATSALDVSVQAQILNLIIDLKERLGLSYLFISHDLSVVQHVCDRVMVLYLGKVMEIAPTAELFADPKHPYTRALLSAIPKEHPREKRERMILQGEVPSPADPPPGCPFHTRCPSAREECKQPPPRKVDGNCEYHCIL